MLGVVELHFEKGIGLLVDDCALRRNQIVSSQINSPLESSKFQVPSFKFKWGSSPTVRKGLLLSCIGALPHGRASATVGFLPQVPPLKLDTQT